jgi:hypothetical protein
LHCRSLLKFTEPESRESDKEDETDTGHSWSDYDDDDDDENDEEDDDDDDQEDDDEMEEDDDDA